MIKSMRSEGTAQSTPVVRSQPRAYRTHRYTHGQLSIIQGTYRLRISSFRGQTIQSTKTKKKLTGTHWSGMDCHGIQYIMLHNFLFLFLTV